MLQHHPGQAVQAAWVSSLPMGEGPAFVRHQEILPANARPGRTPVTHCTMCFLKQMFLDHLKDWQSITLRFNVPPFVKIPNIRKWGLGIEGSVILQPSPLPLAAQLLLALQWWRETEVPPRRNLGASPPSSCFSIQAVNFTGTHLSTACEARGWRREIIPGQLAITIRALGRPPGGIHTQGHEPSLKLPTPQNEG